MCSLNQLMSGVSLAETLNRVENEIKSRTADADLRATFVQLLCLDGNWARALTQLKSWVALKPQAKSTVTLLEQAVQGEIQRTGVFAAGSQPRMPGEAFSWAGCLLAALAADGTGEHEKAAALRAVAFEAATVNPGRVKQENTEHERAVAWLMDGDGRLGPLCELIVNGHYTWLPFAAISELRFQPPASVTDLVWRHTLVRLIDGSEQVCQLPVRYPFDPAADDRIKLSSVTEWTPLDAAGEQFIGHGQKTWLSDENDFPLLGLDVLTFVEADDE
ncbi:protein of avirulence locus ImpE [Erwinia tracheiphila]|uniref:Protein of avirulence locus ImpE n=1 Tax=Erwinia tracheiphila TaxID=65700 RepID=A0A345CUI0_9GAMM|nr:type VI secretion system accessory protein TagJ [Erwinia tracheiphila]AXF77097.1 protein of avirulence locus ImpE [Erwinia tracheiphila]UIA84219.1 protein of avirulence locus ImpE [Erwinia tracheiphila]UIA92800.1 protein of avirulence locus ImpE [Erwinia tracheiphila]